MFRVNFKVNHILNYYLMTRSDFIVLSQRIPGDMVKSQVTKGDKCFSFKKKKVGKGETTD